MRTTIAILACLLALVTAQVTTASPFSTGPYVDYDSSTGLTTTTTGMDVPPTDIPKNGPYNTAQVETGTIGGYVEATAQVEVLDNSTVLFNGFQFCAKAGMVIDTGASIKVATPMFSVDNQDFIVNGPAVKNASAFAVTFSSAPDNLGNVNIGKNLKIQNNANVLFTTNTYVNIGGSLIMDATSSVVFRVLPAGNDANTRVCAMTVDFAGANVTIIGDLNANIVVVRTRNVISQPGAVTLVNTNDGSDGSMLALSCDNKNGCMIYNQPQPTTTMGNAAASVQPLWIAAVVAIAALVVILA